MFPLHQSNELCFQISPNPQTHHSVSEDPILSVSLEDHTVSDAINNKDRLNTNDTNSNNNNNNNKKMKHRDIERQRRQEMASLHASLRSLLPLHLIKGKRSISDHINEAGRYIKHLQVKIKELEAKRDELKNISDPNTSYPSNSTDSHGREALNHSSLSEVLLTIQPCHSGVEILIIAAAEGSTGILPLSRALEVLLGEGLSVISCVSTKLNGRFLHTIHSEATDREIINVLALEQKLNQVILHRRDV